MRHYEILANGCLPYFPNIEACPTNTMSMFPKPALLEANQLYHHFSSKTIEQLTDHDIQTYRNLTTQFLEYTRNYLTTKALANYILQRTGYTSAKRILYLSGDINPDYLRCVTLHGFKTILGEQCHDYPKVPHIYKSNPIPHHLLYGRGMTYSNILDESLHNNLRDRTVEEDIRNGYYDIIIYGSYHRGVPYYDLVSSIYPANKIILLCGEDIHECNYNQVLERGHHVFVRELG